MIVKLGGWTHRGVHNMLSAEFSPLPYHPPYPANYADLLKPGIEKVIREQGRCNYRGCGGTPQVEVTYLPPAYTFSYPVPAYIRVVITCHDHRDGEVIPVVWLENNQYGRMLSVVRMILPERL